MASRIEPCVLTGILVSVLMTSVASARELVTPGNGSLLIYVQDRQQSGETKAGDEKDKEKPPANKQPAEKAPAQKPPQEKSRGEPAGKVPPKAQDETRPKPPAKAEAPASQSPGKEHPAANHKEPPAAAPSANTQPGNGANGDVPSREVKPLQKPSTHAPLERQVAPTQRDETHPAPPPTNSGGAAPAPMAPQAVKPAGQSAAPVKPLATLPPPPPSAAPSTAAAPKSFTPGFQPPSAPANDLKDVVKSRTTRVEAKGRTVIEEPDNRIIVKQDNRVFIRHDETARFVTKADTVHSDRRPDGSTETIIVRPGGIQIFNIVDSGGRTIRRYRRDEAGREVDIIDNRRFYRNLSAAAAVTIGVGLALEVAELNLQPPRIEIPREKYIVDDERASDDDLYEALNAPPVERLERSYSLEDVRFDGELRDRMRRIDLDTITFEFGAWGVEPDQYNRLQRVAAVIKRIVSRDPRELFLIEGHTDAVGSDIDNLSLSDRRAQTVAQILSDSFDVPPENLVTQGYGEQYLKIPTQEPERANRRVAIRRITPLLANNDDR